MFADNSVVSCLQIPFNDLAIVAAAVEHVAADFEACDWFGVNWIENTFFTAFQVPFTNCSVAVGNQISK